MAEPNEIKQTTWSLPKGKHFQAISWAFAVEQLEYLINGIIAEERLTNAALTRINARIDHWLEEQGGGN